MLADPGLEHSFQNVVRYKKPNAEFDSSQFQARGSLGLANIKRRKKQMYEMASSRLGEINKRIN